MWKKKEKTKVILLPNLIGSKPDWAEIKKRIVLLGREDLILFEDSEDTVTYTPETYVAITSFYSSHLITACGSGNVTSQ